MTEARNGGERGFALLIVLWSLALLALLGTRLTSSARTELQLARNIRSSAVMEAQADGLVFETIFRLLKNEPGLVPLHRDFDRLQSATPTCASGFRSISNQS